MIYIKCPDNLKSLFVTTSFYKTHIKSMRIWLMAKTSFVHFNRLTLLVCIIFF